MVADKATLPPAAPTAGLCRRLLSEKTAINAASVVAGIVAAGTAYAALSMVVGIGLGAGILYQAETIRLETGIIPSPQDLVPAVGSPASVFLAAITLSVFLGAFACGRVAYRATRQWLAAHFAMEG